jgi:hypothetical protein
MTGKELLDLTNATGFFRIAEFPGVILPDRQAWLFEGGLINPHPITRDEIKERSGAAIPADEAAKLISKQPDAIRFLKTLAP